MAKTPREKDVSTLIHDQASRLNNPTAEMASLYEQQEEMLGEARHEMRVPRDRPLAQGEVRDRDMDRDPQIIWNGAKIKISQAQMRQLAETGEIEIGDAQLGEVADIQLFRVPRQTQHLALLQNLFRYHQP